MLRKVIILFLIMFLPAGPLVAETVKKGDPDNFKKKTVKTAKKIDNFLQRRQARQTTDTLYIFKPQERWLIRTRSDITRTFVGFKNIDKESDFGFGLSLKSRPKFKQYFGFGYRGVSLGFGIGFNKKSSDMDLSLKIYGNRFGGEVSFNYIGALTGKFKLRDLQSNVSEGDLDCYNIQLSAYYAFQGNRFSMPAAMSQSHIQRRSAGSPLATFTFRTVLLGMTEDERGYSLFETASFFLGIGGGYGYNWVPSKHWLLHISATETLGFLGNTNLRFNIIPDARARAWGRFPMLVTQANLAVIYYYKKFYGGASASLDNMYLPTRIKNSGERYNVTTTRVEGHFTVGFRF